MLSDRADGEGWGREDSSEHFVAVMSMPPWEMELRQGETVDGKSCIGLGAVMFQVQSKPWALANSRTPWPACWRLRAPGMRGWREVALWKPRKGKGPEWGAGLQLLPQHRLIEENGSGRRRRLLKTSLKSSFQKLGDAWEDSARLRILQTTIFVN